MYTSSVFAIRFNLLSLSLKFFLFCLFYFFCCCTLCGPLFELFSLTCFVFDLCTNCVFHALNRSFSTKFFSDSISLAPA